MRINRRDAYRPVRGDPDPNADYHRPASRRTTQPDLSKPIHEYNYPLYRRREIPAFGVLRISLGCWVPLQLVRLSEGAGEQAVPWMVRFGEIKAFPRQQDAWDFLSVQTGYHTRLEIG